jgi:hypothetical protein
MRLLTPLQAFSSPRRSRAAKRAVSLQLEGLESRIVPYSVSGNAWPHPQLVTISFMPDGTNLGGVTSNLFSTFNAKFGSTSTWENQILKAAQTWAQVTNINFAVANDSGAASGGGGDQQGDPSMGDIRIGGYNFGSKSTALAMADMPPSVNNYSIAGDMVFNTAQAFNIGRTYDLYSVALHEFGHALGLEHSSNSSAVMYATYHAVSGLNSDDSAGVEQIYSKGGARSADQYNRQASNTSFSTATNINSLIDNDSLTALVTGLNLDSTSGLFGTTAGVEYFTFTVPAGTTGTMTVNVQSKGLSLLAPTLTVYNSGQSQVAYVSGAGQYGTILSLKVSGVSAGQKFYVKVAGADTSPFGTGAYAMTLNFGSGASPAVPLPDTQTADGNPASGSGGIAEQAAQAGLLDSLLGGLLGGVVQILFDHAPATADPPNFDIFPAGPAPAAAPGSAIATLPTTAPTVPPAGTVAVVSPNWLAAAALTPWHPQVVGAAAVTPPGTNAAPSTAANVQLVWSPALGAVVFQPAPAPRVFAPATTPQTPDDQVPDTDEDIPALWDVGPSSESTGAIAERHGPGQLDDARLTGGDASTADTALSPARCDAYFTGPAEQAPVNGRRVVTATGTTVPAPYLTALALSAGSSAVLGTQVRDRLRPQSSVAGVEEQRSHKEPDTPPTSPPQ